MTTTLEANNAALRSAVEARNEAQAAGVPQDEWYGEQPKRFYGHGPSAAEVIERFAATGTRAEQTLRQAIDAVRDRHGKYGPPTEHFARTAALVNAAFGTTFTAADWALVMVLDKVSRLQGPTPTTDGGIDICGYGSCYEECRQANQ